MNFEKLPGEGKKRRKSNGSYRRLLEKEKLSAMRHQTKDKVSRQRLREREWVREMRQQIEELPAVLAENRAKRRRRRLAQPMKLQSNATSNFKDHTQTVSGKSWQRWLLPVHATRAEISKRLSALRRLTVDHDKHSM